MRIISFLLVFIISVASAWAVEANGTYDITAPTNANIMNWPSGTSPWNYVGLLGGGWSAVYLGNGWVITAAHVTPTDNESYSLNGISYTVVPGSETTVASGVDLTMFQITGTGGLPSLSTLPLAPAATSPYVGESVVMIGYGDNNGGNETWGKANVSSQGGSNTTTSVTVAGYTSTDFELGSTTNYVVTGDSGGGGFTYDGTQWVLSGVLEAQLDSGSPSNPVGSALVNIGTYTSSIDSIMGVPEPKEWALLVFGGTMLFAGAKVVRGKVY